MITTKLMPIGFLAIGVFLLMQIILPIASFQVWELGQKYNNGLLVSPSSLKDNQVLGVSIQNGVSIEKKDNFSFFVSTLNRESKANYSTFQLSIPKLKIEKILVSVDSNDISKGLAHLPGSALPGEKGNVFISGHSALSQLLSLQSAPFSKLQDLKTGDQIILEADNAKYIYQITELKTVSPSDFSVISAPDSVNRFISLMTCVPPGLNFKRLIVLGKMI